MQAERRKRKQKGVSEAADVAATAQDHASDETPPVPEAGDRAEKWKEFHPSIVVSDGVLSMVSLNATFNTITIGHNAYVPYATSGFLLVAIAAGLGTLRFGLMPRAKRLHQHMSVFAAQVGVPLICVAYAMSFTTPSANYYANTISFSAEGINAPSGLAIFLVLASTILRNTVWYAPVVAAIGMMVVIVVSANTNNLLGVYGALCVLGSGLLFGTEGRCRYGGLNVDWFHYLFALGVYFLSRGIAAYGVVAKHTSSA